MAVRLSEQFLEQLRDRIDIEQLIGEYVDLKRAGRLTKGLCPFHSEKTPSFVVYPESQSYYCFGCTKGGDAITFIRDIENLDYIEAVKFLADKAGLSMPTEQYDDTLIKKRKRMIEMNKDAARFFHQYMLSPKGQKGLEYWSGRGLTPQTITHFGLGYAPDDWTTFMSYMRSKGYSAQELFEGDLCRKSVRDEKTNFYPTFKNRVITPIIDLRGNVVAFGGRVLDDSKPKYLNTSDTLIYKKGQNLFAMNFAKASNEDSLILCEGYMDVIALHQAGFTNAVAGLGTALTEEQVRLISHYCSKVYLSYDSDEAGQKALTSAIDKLNKTALSIHPLKYSGAKDPDEVIKKFGPERWKTILSGAMNEIEYKLLTCKEGLDTTTDDGRLKYLRKAVPILAPLGAIEKDIYTSRLSEELSVSKDAIMAQVKDAERRLNRRNKKSDFSSLGRGFDDKVRAHRAEETIITSLMNNPDFLKIVELQLTPEEFPSDFYRHAFIVFSERIKSGQSLDFIYLSSEFSNEEMGHLVKLQHSGALISNTEDEVKDSIKALKEENQKAQQTKDVVELSDEDFLKLFKNNKDV
ncbi:MAG: DNA primase [Oscillospiraceae bacterium]|nr:DNA primase [Candidatus Limimonas coprohippi]